MGKILASIIALSISFTTVAAPKVGIKDLQKEMNISNKKMAEFIKKSYSYFSSSADVQVCYSLLEKNDENAISALYTVLLFNYINKTANVGTDLQQLKRNVYKKKIISHYSIAINYCQKNSTR